MSRKIRCLATALVLVLLSAGAAQARSPQIPPASSGFLDSLWQWLAGHSVPGLTALWEKEGGSMDPDGRTSHVPPPLPTTDAGSDMDPNGRS